MIKVAIGQDSHAFEPDTSIKKLVLGGVELDYTGLAGNSDADVILHALTNAVSGITCVNILGKVSDEMCLERGITDSRFYLLEAMKFLGKVRILHASISVEALKPKLSPHMDKIRESVADLLQIPVQSVGITATTGEGLTEFGKGNGIYCTAILTCETAGPEFIPLNHH